MYRHLCYCYFRLINIDKDTQVLPITVQRTGFINKRVAVSFSTQEMTASTVLLAGNRVYKALAGSDFTQTSGLLTFNPGQVYMFPSFIFSSK